MEAVPPFVQRGTRCVGSGARPKHQIAASVFPLVLVQNHCLPIHFEGGRDLGFDVGVHLGLVDLRQAIAAVATVERRGPVADAVALANRLHYADVHELAVATVGLTRLVVEASFECGLDVSLERCLHRGRGVAITEDDVVDAVLRVAVVLDWPPLYPAIQRWQRSAAARTSRHERRTRHASIVTPSIAPRDSRRSGAPAGRRLARGAGRTGSPAISATRARTAGAGPTRRRARLSGSVASHGGFVCTAVLRAAEKAGQENQRQQRTVERHTRTSSGLERGQDGSRGGKLHPE